MATSVQPEAKQRVYVYGAGGHGKVVADVCRCAGHSVLGFLDDAEGCEARRVLDLPVHQATAWQTSSAAHDCHIALGIGDNRYRRQAAERCAQWSIPLLTAIHPRAVIADDVTLASGTVVMALAVINPGSVIGQGAVINTAAIVEHDNRIGDFAQLTGNAITGGNVTIDTEAFIGLGAAILPGITIGARATIGAGAVVIRDQPADTIAVGVPARRID